LSLRLTAKAKKNTRILSNLDGFFFLQIQIKKMILWQIFILDLNDFALSWKMEVVCGFFRLADDRGLVSCF
jgi:hypothetical protein